MTTDITIWSCLICLLTFSAMSPFVSICLRNRHQKEKLAAFLTRPLWRIGCVSCEAVGGQPIKRYTKPLKYVHVADYYLRMPFSFED